MMFTVYTNLDFLCSILDEKKPLFFDTETDGLYGKLKLCQFYQEGWKSALLIENVKVTDLINLLNSVVVVGHNIAYDITIIQQELQHAGLKRNRGLKKFEDTFYACRLLYPQKRSFSLADCVVYTVGESPYDDINKKDMQKSDWSSELTEEQKQYASYDVIYLQKIWDVVKNKIKNNKSYILDIETVKLNLTFQCNGMPVLPHKIEEEIQRCKARIEEIGVPINVKSNPQSCKYLQSTDTKDETLAYLEYCGDIKAKNVRETRKLRTRISYLNKFLLSCRNNRIEGKFNPNARSGRSTCNHQNLQQIPRSTKNCFGVGKEGVIIYADFSQLELRCITAICNESVMADNFRNNIDVHTQTAKVLYRVEEVTKEQRQMAKMCNFSLLYGAGKNTFAKILLTTMGIVLSDRELQRIMHNWKNLYSSIKKWQEQGYRACENEEVWRTPLGRHYTADRHTDQLNIQVQGMGAEVAKLANIYIMQYLDDYFYRSISELWQRNFIHDSYIFVTPNNSEVYKKVCEAIYHSMQNAWTRISSVCKIKDLPMPVTVLVGSNWGEIEEGKNIIYKYGDIT